MDTEGFPRAEEALRLLAAAVGAARLYPVTSPIPAETITKFVERNAELTAAQGAMRYVADPHGFRIGDTPIAAGQAQIVALAEALHSLQVGQLVLAPGITAEETGAFIRLANSEPADVRAEGGPRAILVAAGVTHLAVIEVSLRASDESGLAGLDLTTAPLDEIAVEVAAAAERRGIEALEGAAGDEMADVIGGLEEATRELAMERVAAAMMRLDEPTRMRVLGWALTADREGKRMDGMLDAIARMKPSALARLLTLVATQAQTEAPRLAAALKMPPETAKLLTALLAPTPSIDPDFGVPDTTQAATLAEEMAVEEDTSDLDRQIAVASPQLTSGRALATAVSLSRTSLEPDTVVAIGEVLPQAARDGAFVTVREALRRLDEIAADPTYIDAVASARATLADPLVLRDVCRAPVRDADAAIAGEIMHAAGTVGAEALLDCYIRSAEPLRSLLRPVLRGMSESLLGVARSRLRAADTQEAVAILRTLPLLGDRRAVPVIAEATGSLDEQVRFAAISALASIPLPEAEVALVKTLNNREPETQRYAVREIGRARAASAVPQLSRALEDINVLSRTYETRKEIIRTLEQIGTPEAEKALRGFAARSIGLGKRTRELRSLAIQVADQLAQSRGVDGT